MAGLVNLLRLFLNQPLSVLQIGGLGLILLLFKGYGCGSYCKAWAHSWWYLSIAHLLLEFSVFEERFADINDL
jgi:hypothetical protein